MVTLNDMVEFLKQVREYLDKTAQEYPQNSVAAVAVERVRWAAFQDVQRAVAPWQ